MGKNGAENPGFLPDKAVLVIEIHSQPYI